MKKVITFVLATLMFVNIAIIGVSAIDTTDVGEYPCSVIGTAVLDTDDIDGCPYSVHGIAVTDTQTSDEGTISDDITITPADTQITINDEICSASTGDITFIVIAVMVVAVDCAIVAARVKVK